MTDSKLVSGRTSSGGTVGTTGTDGWSAIRTWGDDEVQLIALAKVESGSATKINGYITNHNFVDLASIFSVSLDDSIAVVQNDFIENIVLHTYTEEDGNLSIIIGYEESSTWSYRECNRACIESSTAWDQWTTRTDLTGFMSIHSNYAYMAEQAKVSKLNMADETKESVEIANSHRNFASDIDSSLSYIITYDSEFSITILEGYEQDSINKTYKLTDLCASIDMPSDAQAWLPFLLVLN